MAGGLHGVVGGFQFMVQAGDVARPVLGSGVGDFGLALRRVQFGFQPGGFGSLFAPGSVRRFGPVASGGQLAFEPGKLGGQVSDFLAIVCGLALFGPCGEAQQNTSLVKFFADGVEALLGRFIVRMVDQLLQCGVSVGNPVGNLRAGGQFGG